MLFSLLQKVALSTGCILCRSRSLPPIEEHVPSAWTDGLAVHVLADIDDDQASYLGIHLVGHCLAWAENPSSREFDLKKHPTRVSIVDVMHYEAEAGDYGMALVMQVESRLAKWYQNRSEQDWHNYNRHLANTGWCIGPPLRQLRPRIATAPTQRFEPGWAYSLPESSR